MNALDMAIRMAVEAHAGQEDKGGEPYILHPLRVMLAQTDDTDRIAAVLHDVIEDGSIIDLKGIMTFFGEDVHDAVQCLTRQNGEDYFDYIKRVKSNEIATRVKIADLTDNLDAKRMLPGGVAARRAEKYRKAYAMLTET